MIVEKGEVVTGPAEVQTAIEMASVAESPRITATLIRVTGLEPC